jgi:hypothetical protein
MNIAWSSENSSFVDINYSVDGGITWTSVANNIANVNSYTWTVPELGAFESMSIKVTGTDLVTDLVSDTSDEFEVWSAISTDDGTADTTDDEDTSDDEAPAMGYSPVTGELEAIDDVAVGDYIRGESYDTVYYIDVGMVRRPFIDAQTYHTYETSFAPVNLVTNATLASLTLGSPMLPKAGVVLVKIQSDAHVYALELNEDGETELRWITSEAVAVSTYGSAWAGYVIDIPATLFTRFESGADVSNALNVDMGDMRTRTALNS